MTSKRSNGEVYINKIEATRRQLDAAIRMSFAGEDELAIHTVVAAAYRILRDVLHDRGQHDLEELIRAGVYVYARQLVDAKFSMDIVKRLKRLGVYDFVLPIAEALHEAGTSDNLDHMSLQLPEEVKQGHWRSMSKAAGYLKHADRDQEQLLRLNDIDNEKLLMHACGAYAMVTHRPSVEMIVFHLLWTVRQGTCEGLQENQIEVGRWLSQRTPSQQRRACAKMVRSIKKKARLI